MMCVGIVAERGVNMRFPLKPNSYTLFIHRCGFNLTYTGVQKNGGTFTKGLIGFYVNPRWYPKVKCWFRPRGHRKEGLNL